VKRRGSRKSGPLSQSEHDWAFAKRALMRRVPPDQVIERIAEFREGEKHDPLDYARRTVAKAQQMLGSRAKATAEATAADSPQLNRS